MNGRIAHSPSSQKQSHQHTSSQLEFLFEFDDAPVIWSETEIWQLREGILLDALCVLLDGRVSTRLRKDMLLWIQNDEIAPFCFRVCAMAAVVDPDVLRDSIMWLLRRHGTQFD
ncbi:plasmid-related protein [Vibrio vulnificus]|uniref:plasmid-related protein n=1 Tax=Vibrio vulnificus TaxID=672 RepID=UPI00186579A4|nr:plasmid-related protein [Vibrio vulnificus]EGR7942962.1 plasmid-related protein [Vibrio vulnificus]ELV8667256.1 plasmid-related protein [Vibrio vulnificus]MCU8409736.1 plasmid-related protein [Vibrio vulnificus]HAS8323554.1 plasmid-related protein [Vibrio vulnificus]